MEDMSVAFAVRQRPDIVFVGVVKPLGLHLAPGRGPHVAMRASLCTFITPSGCAMRFQPFTPFIRFSLAQVAMRPRLLSSFCRPIISLSRRVERQISLLVVGVPQ